MLKKLAKLIPHPLADRIHAIKHRINWNRKLGTEYRKYFDEYETRTFLADLIRDHCQPVNGMRVFEFGCSGGNNLKLFRERLPVSFAYTGIDLSSEAIRFAKGTFPDDEFHLGDDRAAADLLAKGVDYDIFIASGVLSYLPETRCTTLLKAASKRCGMLVLCDQLDRFHDETGIEDGIYIHPFGRLLQETGWDVTTGIVPSITGHSYTSLVARSVH